MSTTTKDTEKTAPVEAPIEQKTALAEKFPKLAQAEASPHTSTGPIAAEGVHIFPIGTNFQMRQDKLFEKYVYCTRGDGLILNEDVFADVVLPETSDWEHPTKVLGYGTTIFMARFTDAVEADRKAALARHKLRLGNGYGNLNTTKERVDQLLPAGESGTA